MKNHLFVLFCVLASHSFSQTIEINRGNLAEEKSFTRESDFLYEKDGILNTCQYSRVKRSKRKPNALIHGVNEQLNIVSTKELFCLERDDVILKLFHAENTYHVFFQRFNTMENSSTLFAGELNEDGKVSSNIKEVAKVTALSSKTFSVNLSKDSTRYIVECYNNFRKSAISIGKNIHYRLSMIYLDKHLDITRTIQTKHEFIDNYYQSYLHIDSDKLIYVDSGLVKIKSIANNGFAKIKLPKFDSLIFLDQKMVYNQKRGLLYIAGLMTNISKEDEKVKFSHHGLYSSHYYWIKIDCNTNEVLASKAEPFSDELLNAFIGIDEDSRLNNRLWVSRVSDIELGPKGNITMNLRQSRSIESTNGSTTSWFSDGVIILNVDMNGENNWFKSIHLYQKLHSDFTFREFSKWIGDKYLFVYTNVLDKEHKLVALNIDDNGLVAVSTEAKMALNQDVFLRQQNTILNNRLLLSAYERDGLFKSNSFFFEVTY